MTYFYLFFEDISYTLFRLGTIIFGRILWEAIIQGAITQRAIVCGTIIRGKFFLGGNRADTVLTDEVSSNLEMCHQIIQGNKFCSNKHLCIENQGQEKGIMEKVFNLMQTLGITNSVFVNVKVRYNFNCHMKISLQPL